jgi:hypothetical protein
MTETAPTPEPIEPSSAPRHRAAPVGQVNWRRRIIAGIVLLAALVAGYFAVAAAVPRWWSQRIGDAVNGHMSTGALLGVVIGLLCTLLPLIFLWAGVRRHRSWRAVVCWLLLAVVVALPNLCTLGVVAGGGSGAHAGQRTMDVNAPWFRGGSLIGAIAGAVLFLCLLFFALGRGHGSHRERG